MAEPSEGNNAYRPDSGHALREEIAGMRMRTFNRVAATAPAEFLISLLGYETDEQDGPTTDDGAEDDAEQGGHIFVQVSTTARPKVLGVRAGIRITNTKHLIAADSAVEYAWKRAVEYERHAVEEFLSLEAVPRLITYVWTILMEQAQDLGFNVQYHPLRMPESDIVDMLMRQFDPKSSSGDYPVPS